MIRDANYNEARGTLERIRFARTGGRFGRLGRVGAQEIVSASILNCTDMAGNPIDCPSAASPGPMQDGGGSPSTGFQLFTSPNAFSSGTGLGPVKLPSPFSPGQAAVGLGSFALIAAAVIAFLLVTRR
jgi:hypothetical protein